MKKLLLICLVVSFTFSQTVFSQELPQFSPPSPTAYEIAKYGDVTVNESSGTISPNIPLYTYQAGKLQLPMSLSYQGNTVNIDQFSGWTGINWALNAGGVITRTIKDRDDFENSNPNSFLTSQELAVMDFYDLNNTDDALIFNLVNGSLVDSEVDMFNFSFPGYSGSFFLKPEEEFVGGNTIVNLVPYLTKYSEELKIEIGDPIYISGVVGIQSEFREITITTPNGIKYIFGGEHASEQTLIHPESTTPGSLGLQFVQTGYYLHSIIHPYGDEIYFTYDKVDYNIYLARSQSRSLLVSKQTDCPQGVNPSSQPAPVFTVQKIENACFLNEISSNTSDVVVKFDSSTNTINSPLKDIHYKKKLYGIRIKNDVQNTLLNAISLEYHFPIPVRQSIASRFFLYEVAFKDSNNLEEYKYTMEYNDIASLPKRFSANQDHIGNFNNNGNSDGLILPKNNHPSFASVNNLLADKSANFQYATKGSLTKIIYPTGGYTEFEYECPKVTADATPTSRRDLQIYFQDATRNGATLVEDDLTIGLPELLIGGGSSYPPSQTIDAFIDIEIVGPAIVRSNSICVTLYEGGQNGNFIEDKCFNLETLSLNNPISTQMFSFDFVSGESYRLKLSFESRDQVPSGLTNMNPSNQIRADLRFDYVPQESTILVDDVGVRIKKTKAYASSNKPPIIKRYYYKKVKDLNRSETYDSGSTTFPPRYLYTSMIRHCCDGVYTGLEELNLDPVLGLPNGQNVYNMINLQSNSLTNLFTNGANTKMYSDVTISYGGDDFENGGVEKTFSVEGDPLPSTYLGFGYESVEVIPTARENKSVRNGTLLKESIFKKELNRYFILKETTNEYSSPIEYVNFVSNNSCKVMYTRPCSGPLYPTENLYLGLYHTYSHKVLLEKSVVKEFLGDVFLVNSDIASPDTYIETIQDYTYDSPYVSLPSSTKTYTNSNTEWIQKDIYYADDIMNISSLNGSDLTTVELSAINKLKQGDLHQFISPIQIETYKKIGDEITVSQETLLSTQRTNYRHWYNTPNDIVLPITLETSKGVNPLEYRVSYSRYDDKGNPMEISKTGGTPVIYIWGYNKTKPIAKIENGNYQQILGLINNLQTLSNADDDRTIGSAGNEGALRTALASLRTTFNASIVTTYTYDPLIGVTSITDPLGRTIYYNYDEFNRLEFVKDHDGNVLSESEYNYKN